MMLLSGTPKTCPTKTKSLRILNKGDNIAIARSGNMFGVFMSSGHRQENSWDGFFIQKSALKEVKAINQFLTKWIEEQEKPNEKSV